MKKLMDDFFEILQFRKTIFMALVLLASTSLATSYYLYDMLAGDLSQSGTIRFLLTGFNRTVIEDWMNAHPLWKDQILAITIPIAIVYIFVSIFISAGFSNAVVSKDNTIPFFIRKGIKHFLPFLFYALIFHFILALIAVPMIYVYLQLLGHPINDYTTELPFVYSVIVVVLVLLKVISWLWLWSIGSKIAYVAGNSFFSSISMAMKSIWNNKKMSIRILIVFWGLTLLLFICTLLIHKMMINASWWLMAFFYLAMQLVITCRLFVKLFVSKAMYTMYRKAK